MTVTIVLYEPLAATVGASGQEERQSQEFRNRHCLSLAADQASSCGKRAARVGGR